MISVAFICWTGSVSFFIELWHSNIFIYISTWLENILIKSFKQLPYLHNIIIKKDFSHKASSLPLLLFPLEKSTGITAQHHQEAETPTQQLPSTESPKLDKKCEEWFCESLSS